MYKGRRPRVLIVVLVAVLSLLPGFLTGPDSPDEAYVPVPDPVIGSLLGQETGAFFSAQSVPESASMCDFRLWNSTTSNWTYLEGSSHAGLPLEPYSYARYAFTVTSGGYAKIVLSPNPGQCRLTVRYQSGGIIAEGETQADGTSVLFPHLEPGDYQIYVENFQSGQESSYHISLTSPEFTFHSLTVSVGDRQITDFDVAFVPPTVLGRVLDPHSGVMEFWACDSVYAVAIATEDLPSGSALLIRRNVDVSASHPTHLLFDDAGLVNLQFYPEGSSSGSELPTWLLHLRVTTDMGHSLSVFTETSAVLTNASWLSLDYLYLYGTSGYVWAFKCANSIRPYEETEIALGGRLGARSRLPLWVSTSVPLSPELEYRSPYGHVLDGVWLWDDDSEKYLTQDLLYTVTSCQDSSEVYSALRPLEANIKLPDNLPSGTYELEILWDTGDYAGIIGDSVSFGVDNDPPCIDELTVGPLVVAPQDTITVTADARDDLSGVRSVSVYFGSVTRNKVHENVYDLVQVNFGYDEALERYVGKAPAQARNGTPIGQWELVRATVWDCASNRRLYTADDFPNVGFTVEIPEVKVLPTIIPIHKESEIEVEVTLGGQPMADAKIILGDMDPVYTDSDGTVRLVAFPASMLPIPCKMWTKAGWGPTAAYVGVTSGVVGDLDGDGACDRADMAVLTRALGLRSRSPFWDPVLDVVSDGIIDILDIVRLGRRLEAGH